ncbi:MAG: UDP-N-acetylmuramoyl-L-alanine--D-glutamate ligase [bacterium]
MNQPIIFEYNSYKVEPEKGEITFKYAAKFSTGKVMDFIDIVQFPFSIEIKNNDANLDKLLQTLHIILGISYYKLYIPPKIKLSKPLSKEQAEFFNIVYKKGLGEFCYKNKIDPERIAKFPIAKFKKQPIFHIHAIEKSPLPPLYKRGESSPILLGIAGGKDSIVAGELLMSAGEKITGFIVDTNENMEIPEKISKIMGIKTLKIRHILDEKIYQNLPDTYKGHIPFSAIVGALGLLAAYLCDYQYVAVANEYSANFGNLRYKGMKVNHQWSKTSEFEELFQKYIKKFISDDIKYFSLLRPFYEIRVVEMFSKYKKYFPYFTSCNENFKRRNISAPLPEGLENNFWCGKCPKCVFVFTILSAFLPKSELVRIFGKNLYDEKNLAPIFKDLLGLGKLKPFDCVGTFEEMRMAFIKASEKYKNAVIVKNLSTKIPIFNKEGLGDVLKTQIAPNLPERFKLLGIKNALILGYGKEGKTVEKYLKLKYQDIKISIADKKNDARYLEKQKDYDLAIKTPGIPKEKVFRPHTTATNIFFANLKSGSYDSFNPTTTIKAGQAIGRRIFVPQLRPITVGITGSKGKSTTSSLIYAILKEAGFNVELIGNIGNPMLESLMKPIKKDAIFVIELSSYQLDDIKFSPDIAVALNLFPEHMNYHNGVKNYYEAKKNIINFQDKNGIFIYNGKNKILNNWAKKMNSKFIDFSQFHSANAVLSHTLLIGDHNLENIKAAATVAKLFNISDKIIEKAVKNFKPLPHRLEFVGEFKGIKFYDDSISTTPESAIAAIKALNNSRKGARDANSRVLASLRISTILLGGEDRGYNFKNLEKIIKKYKIKNIVLFPDTGKRIFSSKKDRKGLNIMETSSMNEAINFAYKNSPKNSICLLSPASPSYNLWKNFEERGDEFKKLVKKLS